MTDFFTWQGIQLPYFDDPYNTTRLNERCVEIPVALEFLDSIGAVDETYPHPGRSLRFSDAWQGLEVGNVLHHYGVEGHRVVDRHEVAPSVENLDVFNITAHPGYDWIVAVSTLEHVRWDEEPREVDGAVRALWHLRSLLKPQGKMLVTVPMGSNPGLDVAILSKETGASRSCTMSRSPEDIDQWVQDEDVTWRRYGERTIWAESVWIGEFGE